MPRPLAFCASTAALERRANRDCARAVKAAERTINDCALAVAVARDLNDTCVRAVDDFLKRIAYWAR